MFRASLTTLATMLLTTLAASSAAAQGAIPGFPGGLAGAPGPEQSHGVLLDRVVATANEGIITESELQEAIAAFTQQMRQQGSPLPDAEVLRARMLDFLVTQQLQLIRAERRGITVSEEQISQAVREWATQQKLEYARLPELLPGYGMEYAVFRDNMRKNLLIEMVTQREVGQRIVVTPREVEQAMAQLKRMPDENAEYDVSDILISLPDQATQAELDEVAREAQEVYERSATEDFASLAAQYSDAGTGLKGGALGWLKGTELPSWAVDVIPGLNPGEVSKPIPSSWGYHVARLNAVRHDESATREQVRVRRIMMKPNALRDDATIALRLSDIRQQILDGGDFVAFATLSEESETSGTGGEMEWMEPREFRSETIARVVAGLQENEISEPFQAEAGWYIVQLLGRRHIDMTEEDLRERATIQLFNSKAAEEEEMWLRELRGEAYINTDL